jgi:hypothetical protein
MAVVLWKVSGGVANAGRRVRAAPSKDLLRKVLREVSRTCEVGLNDM